MQLSDEEWRKRLTPEQYHVLREKGTEPPFSGELLHNEADGTYKCAACSAAIFDSSTKFETTGINSGWPSFYDAIPGSIKMDRDSSLGMDRMEITCANCGSHLGHLFDDGPPEVGGNHFCVNSAALDFKSKK